MFEFSLAETNLVPDVAMRKGLSMTDCYSKLWTFSNEYFPRDFIERERREIGFSSGKSNMLDSGHSLHKLSAG